MRRVCHNLGSLLTIGEIAYCKPFRRLSNVSQSQIGLSLPDHQVYNDQSLEDYGPGGISQTQLQGAKDVCNPSLTAMCRGQDCLDIFRLWSCELDETRVSASGLCKDCFL